METAKATTDRLAPPGVMSTVLRGTLFGLLIAVMGSCLFAVCVEVMVDVPILSQGRPVVRADNWFYVVITFVAVAIAAFVFAVVPAAIGGVLIALMLRGRVQRRGRLTRRTINAVGLIGGLGAGGVTALVVTWLMSPDYAYPEFIFPVTMGIAALCGLLHSRWVGKWLEERTW